MHFIFTATVFLLTFLGFISAESSHLGCFGDVAEIQQRTLPYVQLIDRSLTVEKCLSICDSRGFAYAGIEYASECYCSKYPPLDKLQLDKNRCNMDCAGAVDDQGRKCGGASALSVYHNSAVQSPSDPAELSRPLLCLVMILKNEAHTILDTLKTVWQIIDHWIILDTGSTDGTQKVIQDFFAEKRIPGKLFQEEFVDYGFTRNRVLTLAKEQVNPIFTLMLSADEKMLNANDTRAFLEDMRFANGTMHGAYPVVMNTGLKFDSIRLARVDAGWRYRARVHEYLAPPTGPYIGLYRSHKDLNVLFNATDGPRRHQSQYFIRKILEEDLARDPYDTRSIYYLARTNSGIDNHTAAFYYYDLLAQRSKWDEEVYHGMVMKALESKLIPTIGWQQRQQMFLEAFQYKPNSMDAIHALAQDHFDSGRFHLAYIFALRAVQIPAPEGLRSSENVLLRPTRYLYDYEGNRLLGFAAREVAEWSTCVSAYRAVLLVMPADEIVKNRITLCETKLAEQGKSVEKNSAMQPCLPVFNTVQMASNEKKEAAGTDNQDDKSNKVNFQNNQQGEVQLNQQSHSSELNAPFEAFLEYWFVVKSVLAGVLLCSMLFVVLRRYRMLPNALNERKLKI
jgi:glycosyltransferase involved in cell wall biosynthesis